MLLINCKLKTKLSHFTKAEKYLKPVGYLGTGLGKLFRLDDALIST